MWTLYPPRPIQPYHFQPNLIWCDGTFNKIWRWVSKHCRILHWFRKCWEKCEKFADKKVISKKRVQNGSLSFGKYQTFSLCTFFQIFPRIWNQRKIAFLDTHMQRKKEKKNWGHWIHLWVFLGTSRMQIHKKLLNQLKNLFNKHFKNIIWQLFAGEPHEVVKITVTYRRIILVCRGGLLKRMVYSSLGAGAGAALCYPTQDRRRPHQFLSVFRSRIHRSRIHRIHMFLGLPDPDPLLVRGMDPDPDPSIIKQ